jgi:hypothetical protein
MMALRCGVAEYGDRGLHLPSAFFYLFVAFYVVAF